MLCTAFQLDTLSPELSVCPTRLCSVALCGAVAAESLRGGAPGDRHAEVGRLKAIAAPVLNVTNLATIDVLNDDYLTAEQAKAFRSKFGYAGGSWCCAPSEEKGAPRNAHFSLMRA